MMPKKRVVFQIDKVDSNIDSSPMPNTGVAVRGTSSKEDKSEESDDFDIYGRSLKRRFNAPIRQQLMHKPIGSKSGRSMKNEL